jgi:D-amino-acid dehydrogenase
VPLATPGILRQVPGWLFDKDGPLFLRPGYLPKALPWLWRFVKASERKVVEASADGLRALQAPLFENLDPLLAEAGARDLVRRNGQIYAYSSEAGFAGDAYGRELRRSRGVSFDILGEDEIRQMEPALAPIFRKAVFYPEHGNCLDPYRLVAALADAFRSNGGTVLQRRVHAIAPGSGGPVRLETDGGAMDTDSLVVAAGAWSHTLAKQLGHKVPLETQRGYHVTIEAPSAVTNRGIMWAERKFIATPMEMGLRLAGTVEFAGLDAAPDYARADALMRQAQEMFGGLEGKSVSKWMGHRPCLPDSLPVIGPSPQARNVFFAFGHGHVGLTCASTTGRLVSELVAGTTPCIDPEPYRIDRF